MTVIRPNSVSGITSITAQANEINVFRSNGTLAGLNLNGVNFNTTAGISTLAALNVTGNVDIAGVLTYQDVTNVDSIGIITARNGINVTGNSEFSAVVDIAGDLAIADTIKHIGDSNTKIRFPSVDTVSIETAGDERLRIKSDGVVNIGSDVNNTWIDSTLKVRKDQNAVTKIAVRNENQGSSSSAAIVVNSYGNSWMFDCGSAAKNSNALTIRVDATSNSNQGTEKLRIKTNGNVGLGGETNPITTLSINRGDTGANTTFLNAELIRIDGYGSTNSKSGIGFGRYNAGQNGSIPAAFIGAQTGTWSNSTNCHLIFATRDSTGNVEPTERLRITSAGNLEPSSDNTYNFGSLTKRWANLYTADLNLSNEGKVNDVDGTWGQYTIQEGEDNLYLINKRSGKKYKFLLQEVS